MWEARARYADGYEVWDLIPDGYAGPAEYQKKNIARWLKVQHEGLVWGTIRYVEDDEV